MRETEVKLEVKKCPFCAQGLAFNAGRRRFSSCKHCSGKGVVAVNANCACGGPVTTLAADGTLYCGNKQCLKDLKDDEQDALKDDDDDFYGVQSSIDGINHWRNAWNHL
jgi:hypothetical protein